MFLKGKLLFLTSKCLLLSYPLLFPESQNIEGFGDSACEKAFVQRSFILEQGGPTLRTITTRLKAPEEPLRGYRMTGFSGQSSAHCRSIRVD